MKVKASRNFNIFFLFCHDMAETLPFDQWSLAKDMNVLAETMFPEAFIQFVTPSDNGLDQWQVRYNKNRYEYGDYGVKFETYPKKRCYTEAQVRKAIPKALDAALVDLDIAELLL